MANNTLPELLPVVVLIPEAWHTPVHYSSFIDAMSSLGYAMACEQLPTGSTETDSSESDNMAGFNDDVSMIYQLVFDLVSDGNDIVVIAHGYGGFVASEALTDLGKEERAGAGKSGGVVGLISVAGLLPVQGDTLLAAFGGEWPDYITEKKDGTIKLDDPEDHLYSDLGPMESAHWSSHLVPFTAEASSIRVQADPPAYTSIPTTYIICEDDAFIPEDLQRHMSLNAHGFVDVIECAAHDAFIAKTEDVVDAVGRAVGSFYGAFEQGDGSEPGVDAGDNEGKIGDEGDGVESPGSAASAASAPQESREEDRVDFVKTGPLRRTTTAPS